jgi:hypothetical protein
VRNTSESAARDAVRAIDVADCVADCVAWHGLQAAAPM